MPYDAELLRAYANDGSHTAFAELVSQHLNLVYFAAWRRTGDPHLAEDIAQEVFTVLAQNAAELSRREVLASWLYTTTRFIAAKALRARRRRQEREQEAYAMHDSSPDPDWQRLRPMLDESLDQLSERDRSALLLRFFSNLGFAEIAEKLALTEDAARMRVGRALDKLHGLLTSRGITSTSAALGLALASESALAAPAGLAASVSSIALAGAAAAPATIAGTLFAMSKIKTALVGVVVFGLLAPVALELRANRTLHRRLDDLPPGPPLAKVQREKTRLTARLAELSAVYPNGVELTRLRQRAAILNARPAGVLESEFKSATTWQDRGRETPAAANETLHWAMRSGNLDAIASMIVFRDDTPAARAAFMAKCSEAIRQRYQTPERVVAAAFFGSAPWGADHDGDAIQYLGQDDHVGGDGARFGQQRLRVWYRMANGREFEGGSRWQPTPQGWAIAAIDLSPGSKPSDSALRLLDRLDPTTGDQIGPK